MNQNGNYRLHSEPCTNNALNKPMAKIEDTEKLEVKKDSLPWLPHACPIIAIQFNPYIIYSMATPLKPNQARSESSWFSKLPP